MSARSQQSDAPAGRSTWPDVCCPACCCVCDDLTVTVRDGQVVDVGVRCPLARRWFVDLPPSSRPQALVEGNPAAYDDAVTRAARCLLQARRPVVYGLTAASCEAAGEALALAERLHAVVDLSWPSTPVTVAVQEQAWLACTLGEVRHRADVVVLWRVDTLQRFPRLLERYAPFPFTGQTPHGPTRRWLVTVGLADAQLAKQADWNVSAEPDDAALAGTLQAAALGRTPTAEQTARTGLSRDQLDRLLETFRRARYGVFFVDTAADGEAAGCGHVEPVLRLVQAWNRFGHWRAVLLGASNQTGAQAVLTWQTGFPGAVWFEPHGLVSYQPEVGVPALLARGEPDAALLVADEVPSTLPPPAARHLRRIPTVVVSDRDPSAVSRATVGFLCARLGVECGGTVHRVDGVPLRLRPPVTTDRPSVEQVLRDLRRAVERAAGG